MSWVWGGGGTMRWCGGRLLVGGGGDGGGSAWWPGHPPAPQHVGVDVKDRLPRLSPGVEDDTVAVGRDALGVRYLLSLERHLGQQPSVGAGERGQVRIVLLGDDQDVRRRLRVDITKCECSATFCHPLGWDVARDDLAEEAIGHERNRSPDGMMTLRICPP